MSRRFIPFLMSLLFLGGCSNETTLFKAVGNTLAAPVSLAVDVANLRAYVVNSNNNVEFTSTTFSILDITNPAAPTLVSSSKNPISIPNFSGQIYYDAAARLAYVTNRLTTDVTVTPDTLLRINVNEAAVGFATVDSFTNGENPFGLACCDASGRMYSVGTAGTLNVFNPADLSTSVSISLAGQLSTGEIFSGINSTEVVLKGTTQAFVTNRGGRIYVINTAEVGDTSKNPIDSIITVTGGADLRGIATNGTSLFVVDATSGTPVLRVVNPATLTLVSPDVASFSEVDISTIQTAAVSVGTNPNEVVVFKGKAYVSNQDSNSVTVIDTTNNTVTATIAVGLEPFGLNAFTVGTTDYLYVTNLKSNSISIIDIASNTVVATFAP